MKISYSVVACLFLVFAKEMCAREKTFELGRAGFLVNSNRFAIASFSEFKLTVNELDGQFMLPCIFAYKPGIGGDKCSKIVFSSVWIERNQNTEMQPMLDSAKATADNSLAMPRRLLIGPLFIGTDDSVDDPLDVVFTVTEAKSADICRRHDACLYRRVPETYFRYLCSDESDIEYWWVRFLGKRVEYRIWPVCCSGNDYVVENSDVKSKHFSKMTLTYAKIDDDFRLKKIVLMGDHSYQGGPFLEQDPAVFEAARIFVKSKFSIVEGDPEGIVERGYGMLKCKRNSMFKAFKGKFDAQFRVELEMSEN